MKLADDLPDLLPIGQNWNAACPNGKSMLFYSSPNQHFKVTELIIIIKENTVMQEKHLTSTKPDMVYM